MLKYIIFSTLTVIFVFKCVLTIQVIQSSYIVIGLSGTLNFLIAKNIQKILIISYKKIKFYKMQWMKKIASR